MPLSTVDFAILAPLHAAHIPEGIDVCMAKPYVSFGSNKWDLFRANVDAARADEAVPVLVYASHDDARPAGPFRSTYAGWYVGHTHDVAEMRREEKEGYRPASMVGRSDERGFAVHWHIAGLHVLAGAQQIEIQHLVSYSTGKRRSNAAPEGPELIQRPSFTESAEFLRTMPARV